MQYSVPLLSGNKDFASKSTQVPQMLLESDLIVKSGKEVVVTQPRQLAAQKVGERIAEELDVRLGSTVGVTDLGAPSPANEWVIYHECRTGEKKDSILLVSPIVPEMLVKAVPTYFGRVEFFPDGPTKTALVKIISNMTGEPEELLRGFPLKSSAATAAATTGH